MSDTGNLTVNILGSGGDSAIITTNMVESSSVTANVVTGARGEKGDKGDTGTTDYNELVNLPTLGTAAAKDIPATGNASATEVVYGTDTRLTDSRPASDVSAWAKAPSKPTYTKSEVGLSNADDTSDANKPISTATQSALDTKATTTALDAHANSTANPHSVTKAQVGLGNVDNTSDANKPVSTAQQTALNGKQDSDATLTALAAHNTNGILTQTAADTFTGRTITGTNNQVTVTNGDGVNGDPKLSLPQNIHTTAQPTFGGETINGNLAVNGNATLGAYLNSSTANTNTAPQVVSKIWQNNRGIIDAVGAMSGFGDYFYCLDRNPTYTITTTGVTNAPGMFDNNLSGGADIPVADLATTPAVIEIVRTDGGRINFTDVLTLWIAGHRLWNEEALTSYKVETKCSDGVWRTELDRTGVSDQINGVISIPLHVTGATYAAGDTGSGWHACHGIRLTIRGATAPSWNGGKFRIAELQLRDGRPAFSPARGLGALDMRGGDMYGDIRFPSVSGTRLGWSDDKLSFYGATPIVRPTSTPANATDLATALTLVNDLKAKLIALGLIS